jgi:hypothetical protein
MRNAGVSGGARNPMGYIPNTDADRKRMLATIANLFHKLEDTLEQMQGSA